MTENDGRGHRPDKLGTYVRVGTVQVPGTGRGPSSRHSSNPGHCTTKPKVVRVTPKVEFTRLNVLVPRMGKDPSRETELEVNWDTFERSK